MSDSQERGGVRSFVNMRRRDGGSRIAALTDFSLLRLRHRDAWSVDLSTTAKQDGFESLEGALLR